MSKKLIQILGFKPKENASDIFIKKYMDGYAIEVDFESKRIHYGNAITVENEGVLNFSPPENWVVLECVNRLLEKGYKPENIILEKTWPTGHKTSGRLDILVSQNDGSPYLMIECKTWGAEFDKEFKRLQRNGGQLFTYFQQDKDADVLMLYASQLNQAGSIQYRNEIIKIEEDYRQAGSVEDFYRKWNKTPTQREVWENPPYDFQLKKFVKEQLRELNEDEGKKLFHGFASILRKHSVSDKPNAFNVIFNLFLAKLYDEQKRDVDELEFCWRENDDPVDFQVRLYNLHKEGLYDFLKKEIEGIQDADFKTATPDELKKAKKKFLKFNKLFDIKSVLDDDDFEQNHRVLKEVVKLIEEYRIRYPRKQRYLSEFFELLLTTGLKQEVGQYFTPPPITKFIVKSLPLREMLKEQINNPTPRLPATIDYAAGSGHFITEILEEYQDIITGLDTADFFPKAKAEIAAWKENPYSWAASYIYGIEKDYRLVKVAKVGCYFYGDGLAQVIHGDGLDSFEKSKTYKGLLKENINLEDSSKAKFSVVVSNPPYSVEGIKDDLEYIGAQDEFTLSQYLTDKSKEIEALFVERTKQLLKDGGVAGIILPSSILSNTGIYTRAREIILQNFEIIAITELGSNTFMATPVSTVVLFLRRRNNYYSINLRKAVEKFFIDHQDFTQNGVEKPANKYVAHVWEGITFSDYITLLKKEPNIAIEQHELYKEYRKKLKAKSEADFWKQALDREAEKLLYFILAYPQKVVLVKSGQKDDEKRFLGYEFSNRRGSQGIHPIQRSKSIAECTKLFDEGDYENLEKASTYIYKAFKGDYETEIHPSLQLNISRHNLVDMLIFDRVEFEKTISLAVKKKVKIESTWDNKRFDEVAEIIRGVTYSKGAQTTIKTNIIILTADNITLDGNFEVKKKIFLEESFKISNEKRLVANDIFICFSSGSKEHLGKVAFIEKDTAYYAGGFMGIIRVNSQNSPKYFFHLLNITLRQTVRDIGSGSNINNLSSIINEIQIPLPPIDIQEKIVAEIETLEKNEGKAKEEIEKLKNSISVIIGEVKGTKAKLQDVTTKIGSGATPLGGEGVYKNEGITFIRSQNVYDSHFVEDGLAYIDEEQAKKLEGVTVEKNDILFNITGASIARCCVVEDKYLPARVNQHVSIIRTNEKALPKYVQLILVSKEYKDRLLQIGEGATSRQAITKSQLENFDIPLPSISEQQKIVSEIEKIESKIVTLEKELADLPKQKAAILKRYL